MPQPIMRYFEFSHLPPALGSVSAKIYEAAHALIALTPPGDEQNAGLRKLLEAKDCFVRAALPQPEIAEQPTEPV